jgi:hypothetical protein
MFRTRSFWISSASAPPGLGCETDRLAANHMQIDQGRDITSLSLKLKHLKIKPRPLRYA